MTVEHLDRAAAGRPVVISHANGHLMNVNSAMLRLAEITRDNEVEGVVRFAPGHSLAGEPTGELQEPAAMFLVLRKIGNAGLLAPMTEAGVRSFARLACRQGVTTATDLVNKLGEQDCRVLEAALGDDQVPIRILPAFQAFHGTHGAEAGAEHVRTLMARNTDRLRYGLVKMMLDGSIQGFRHACAGPVTTTARPTASGSPRPRSTRPISRPTTAQTCSSIRTPMATRPARPPSTP